MDFYRIVRASYTIEEWAAMGKRAEFVLRAAKIRGLIPWDYDGERDEAFDWPQPPELFGEEAA